MIYRNPWHRKAGRSRSGQTAWTRTKTLRRARHGSTLPSRAATCNGAADDDYRRALAVVTFARCPLGNDPDVEQAKSICGRDDRPATALSGRKAGAQTPAAVESEGPSAYRDSRNLMTANTRR